MNLAMLHSGALGDCVLTLHVAMGLRAAGHRVTVAARSPIAVWAARRGLIDEAVALDKFAPILWGTGPVAALNSDGISLLARLDCVISFLGGPGDETNQRLANIVGADRIIAINPSPNELMLREGTHIAKQWAHEIRKGGLDFELDFSILKSEISNIENVISQKLIIHPGSGGREKCCPLHALESLMSEFMARKWQAQWMIGPDEMERDGPEFRRRLERTAGVIYEDSLPAAADLVTSADVYIGNDAGMTHVAAIAGVNTVALFGPTDPCIWRPLGPRCTAVSFPTAQSDQQWLISILRTLEQDG